MIKAIKELNSRARAEVSLREAINQLEAWCMEREYEFLEYSNNKKTTPLIKEWKDLMTDVSDNLAFLGALKDSKFNKNFKE